MTSFGQENYRVPHTALATVFVLPMSLFLLVKLFPSWLYRTMDIASYLVFHNIAEFFSVMVSLSIFGVGWFTYEQSKNRHALFLSCAFLAIGLMDFMHTLGYAGMPAFITPNSSLKSTQFWIAVRMYSALAFLVSGYVRPEPSGRFLSQSFLLASAVVVPIVVFAGVTYFPSYLPATIIEGKGVTPFKMYSEYLIILLFALAIPAYWRRYAHTGTRQFLYYMAAFILCIFSELAFSGYKSVFDTYNVLGHINKVIAFSLIYQAIFIAAVKSPYLEVMSKSEELRIESDEHKKAEDLLRKTEELAAATLRGQHSTLRSIIDSTNALIFSVDQQYRYTSFNKAHAAVMKTIYGAEIKPGHNMLEYITVPEDRETAKRNLDQALAGEQLVEESYSGEELLSRQYFHVSHSPTKAETGEVIGVAVLAQDMTERKRAEEALRQSQRKLAFHLEQTLFAVIEWDAGFRVRYWNPAAERIFGYTNAEALGKRGPELMVPREFHADIEGVLEKLLNQLGGVYNQNTNVTRDGKLIECEWINTPLLNEHGKATGIMSIVNDVTERKLAEEEIRKLNEELEQRVMERTAELEQANSRLQELDRMKSMFIASMSHELRTPLNSAIGYSRILLNEWAGPLNDEQKENLNAVLRSGNHLLSLVNDVIDVSRIEAGMIEAFPEEFDLYDVISEAVTSCENAVLDKGVDLKVQAIHRTMHTDRTRLLQCLLNLVSNAVKYTEKGAITINVEAADGGSALEISVTDTGIGIPDEDMGKLFSPFVRLESPHAATIPGTGLGLYLTRKLLNEVLRGDITVSSARGVGSRFVLTVPVNISDQG
jgi:PAS domain S-box-containing protein